MTPKDGRVIPIFFMQALQGQSLTIYGDGKQTRSLCYVTDMVAQYIILTHFIYPTLQSLPTAFPTRK